jgi:hypothetical protein
VGVRVTAPDIAAASAPVSQSTATAGAATAAVPVLIAAAAQAGRPQRNRRSLQGHFSGHQLAFS